MKKEVSPAVIFGVIAALLVIIGVVAFRTFYKDPNYTPSSPEEMKRYQEIHAKDAELWQQSVGRGGSRGANSNPQADGGR